MTEKKTNKKVPFILTHPSFDNIKQAVNHIVEKMNEDGYRPDRIVALARGGAILGVMLSHRMNIPVTIVAYSSKAGAGDNRNHDNVLPPLTNKKLLIVDDLVDSGKSMEEVVAHYSGLIPDNNFRVATIYAKEKSVVEPDYYWHWLAKDAPFIHFPWETI